MNEKTATDIGPTEDARRAGWSDGFACGSITFFLLACLVAFGMFASGKFYGYQQGVNEALNNPSQFKQVPASPVWEKK